MTDPSLTSPTAPPTRHAAWNLFGNPIFRRYCRSRLRLKGLAVSLLVVVLLSGFFVALTTSLGVNVHLSPADAVRNSVMPLLVLQALILFVLGTAQVAGGMTAERDEGVIDYQRLIPMSPLSKVLGYLFGLPVREYVMVLASLPFTAWALWRGGVSWQTWLPLYGIVFTSALTYHFTGLVTGTVAKNRRWAFLASIGLVFALYTVIPQMAKFGLVFFKYLTITPVLDESLPSLLPTTVGAVVSTARKLSPSVRFFGLNFSESVFTLFSQGALIITFAVMLCRKWRRHDSLLLGKFWALGFFVWIQILLLGNSLPLIEPGTLFPSRGFFHMIHVSSGWKPFPMETVAMSAVYGVVSLALICLLSGIATPSREMQTGGWRRAVKRGHRRLSVFSDSSTAYGSAFLMALAGAAGWYTFSHALIESRWFPGQVLPLRTGLWFFAVLFGSSVAFQALLEWKGGRSVVLAAILIGALPLMVGAVLWSMKLVTVACWVIGISPLSLPFYASASLLPIPEFPIEAARAIPHAFPVWLAAAVITSGWLAIRLFSSRRAIARETLTLPR